MNGHHCTDAAATDVVRSMTGTAWQVRGTVRVAPAVLIQLIELTVDSIDGVVVLWPCPGKPWQAHTPE